MAITYPYKFSDWYGYDQDCSPYIPFSAKQQGNITQACQWEGSLDDTFYRTVSGPLTAGQVIYSNNSGTLAGAVVLVIEANGGTNNRYIVTATNSQINSSGDQLCF